MTAMIPDDYDGGSDRMRERISELEGEVFADLGTINELRAAAVADQRTIAALQADGVIDRSEITNLKIALESARRIGTAIGMLMTQRKVTSADAFELLAGSSQDRNQKLRDVADYVIEVGTLPGS